MPRLEPALTDAFRGRKFAVVRLRKGSSWHEQASKHFHHGFPRKKGLWVLPITAFSEGCDCHPVRLFLQIRVDGKGAIERVETVVCRPYADGSFDEMDLPFHYPDMLSATKELEQALSPTSLAALRKARAAAAGPALLVSELVVLLGLPVSAGPVKRLVKRFGLATTPDMLGEGTSYTGGASRLEVKADLSGRVSCIFLRPGDQDLLRPTVAATEKRGCVRAHFGLPTYQSCDPVDFDRYDYPDHVTHFSYARGGKVSQVTLMSPQAAPCMTSG